MQTINKELGEGTLMMASDPLLEVKSIPTGIVPVDLLLRGGFPRNRSTELFGDYSTLKSYIGLAAVKQVQDMGGVAAIIDTEHAFDPEWATSLGIDTDDLIIQHPENGELAVDVTEVLLRQNVDLIIWDSVAATLPESEQTKREAGEKHQPARLAALMSRAMRKLTAANSSTALVFINQTRINVGQMFGNPEAVPGGKAIPFYASHRVALRKSGRIQEDVKLHDGEKSTTGKVVTAQKIRATLEKSKLTTPHRDVVFQFDLKSGTVDSALFLFAQGVEHGFLHRKGAIYTLQSSSLLIDENEWKGKQAVLEAIRENGELWQEMVNLTWESHGLSVPHNSEA